MCIALCVAGSAVLLGAAPPASAELLRPASNLSADLGALNAYRTYLTSLGAGGSLSEAAVAQVAANVTSACPGALKDLNRLSSVQLRESALASFANEIDAGLALAYIGPSEAALNRFGGVLAGLSWSAEPPSSTTTRLIATSRALLNTPAPALCADARTLDAAPLNEPDTTRRFLRRYRNAAQSLKSATASFQALLVRFETASERRLVAQINALVSQFDTQAASAQTSTAAVILSTLGVRS